MNVGTFQEGVRRGEGRREALRRVLPRRLRPGEGPAGVGVRRFGGRAIASTDSRCISGAQSESLFHWISQEKVNVKIHKNYIMICFCFVFFCKYSTHRTVRQNFFQFWIWNSDYVNIASFRGVKWILIICWQCIYKSLSLKGVMLSNLFFTDLSATSATISWRRVWEAKKPVPLCKQIECRQGDIFTMAKILLRKMVWME